MFLFSINYSFLSFALLASAPDTQVEHKSTNSTTKYLYLSYANFMRENPGGNKKASSEEKNADISMAKELTNAGY